MPRLYSEFADWWPLLSDPASYVEEAAIFLEALEGMGRGTMLELGCGGGNNASHLKRHFSRLTLVDRSRGMLEVSRALNPECVHIQGDMRTIRLAASFEIVFLHDALSYLTSEDDVRATCRTAAAHAPVALFVPDWMRENFRPELQDGGHDGGNRSLRHLTWIHDPDPSDTAVTLDFVYALREGDAPPRVVKDQHICGLFPRATWLDAIREAGFKEVEARPFLHSSFPESAGREFYVAVA